MVLLIGVIYEVRYSYQTPEDECLCAVIRPRFSPSKPLQTKAQRLNGPNDVGDWSDVPTRWPDPLGSRCS